MFSLSLAAPESSVVFESVLIGRSRIRAGQGKLCQVHLHMSQLWPEALHCRCTACRLDG